jgi:hypothetical protein
VVEIGAWIEELELECFHVRPYLFVHHQDTSAAFERLKPHLIGVRTVLNPHARLEPTVLCTHAAHAKLCMWSARCHMGPDLVAELDRQVEEPLLGNSSRSCVVG